METFSPCRTKVPVVGHSVAFAAFQRAELTGGGLTADCDKASGDFRQPMAGTSAFHVARLGGFIAPAKYEAKPWFKPIDL